MFVKSIPLLSQQTVQTSPHNQCARITVKARPSFFFLQYSTHGIPIRTSATIECSLTAHTKKTYMGCRKNHVLCRKNYIKYNSNYIRPFLPFCNTKKHKILQIPIAALYSSIFSPLCVFACTIAPTHRQPPFSLLCAHIFSYAEFAFIKFFYAYQFLVRFYLAGMGFYCYFRKEIVWTT